VKPVRGACVLALLLVISCGKSIDRQVSKAVREFDEVGLARQDIEVVDIKKTGSYALAEVKIHTALKLVNRDGTWVIEEIHLGDGHWEKAEHIMEALNRARTETTINLLQQVDSAIRRYSTAEGKVPDVEDYEALIDLLTPRYIEKLVPSDGWSRTYFYRAVSNQEYDLRSAGPDGMFHSADDVTIRSPQ
jgi:hypothetical protein